jgi:hypothetical protein
MNGIFKLGIAAIIGAWLLGVAGVIGIVYVIVHFAAKFW